MDSGLGLQACAPYPRLDVAVCEVLQLDRRVFTAKSIWSDRQGIVSSWDISSPWVSPVPLGCTLIDVV